MFARNEMFTRIRGKEKYIFHLMLNVFSSFAFLYASRHFQEYVCPWHVIIKNNGFFNNWDFSGSFSVCSDFLIKLKNVIRWKFVENIIICPSENYKFQDSISSCYTGLIKKLTFEISSIQFHDHIVMNSLFHWLQPRIFVELEISLGNILTQMRLLRSVTMANCK